MKSRFWKEVRENLMDECTWMTCALIWFAYMLLSAGNCGNCYA